MTGTELYKETLLYCDKRTKSAAHEQTEQKKSVILTILRHRIVKIKGLFNREEIIVYVFVGRKLAPDIYKNMSY